MPALAAPVAVFADFGYSPQGQAYLVMEYLEGEELGHTLHREGRLPWFRVSDLILQVASALAAAHAKGIVHRDMKPENCFRVRREGSSVLRASSGRASTRCIR